MPVRRRREFVPAGRLNELNDRPDANLLLLVPPKRLFDDYEVLTFTSRKALEEFAKRNGLRPVVFTPVKQGMKVHSFQVVVD